MKTQDKFVLLLLLALAAYIWLRDLSWWGNAWAALPLLVGLPAFVWWRRPWQTRARALPWSLPALVLTGLLLAAGHVFDGGFLFAAAWTTLLVTWMHARFTSPTDLRATELLGLPLLAFPWPITDLGRPELCVVIVACYGVFAAQAAWLARHRPPPSDARPARPPSGFLPRKAGHV